MQNHCEIMQNGSRPPKCKMCYNVSIWSCPEDKSSLNGLWLYVEVVSFRLFIEGMLLRKFVLGTFELHLKFQVKLPASVRNFIWTRMGPCVHLDIQTHLQGGCQSKSRW